MITIHDLYLQIRKHCYLSMCALVVCIGIFYFSCAVLVTIIPHYQEQIAREFTDIIGERVDFSKVKFSWRGLRLYARLYNVDVGSHGDKIHIDNIRKIEFLLHPVKSVVKLKPDIDDIIINGGTIYFTNQDNQDKQLTQANDKQNSGQFTSEKINYYLTKVLKKSYLDWVKINQVNLKNTIVIVSDKSHKQGYENIVYDKQYIISELKIDNTGSFNYLHGLIYQINKQQGEHKDREIIEFALKFNDKSSLEKNRFYLATNSKGLEYLLKDLMSDNENIKLELDSNTWLKVWGSLNVFNVKKLQLALESPKVILKIDNKEEKSKKEDIELNNIQSHFELSFENKDSFLLDIKKIDANFSASKFKIVGNIFKKDRNTPATINSYITFGLTDVRQFFAKIPKNIIGSDASSWLQEHVKKGWLGRSEIVWRGNLDDSFPYDAKYDKPNGSFRLKSEVLNTEIDYSPGAWPKIKKLNAMITMHGRDLKIESSSAKIINSQVKHIQAELNDLGRVTPNMISIKGSLATSGNDLHKAIATTQLREHLSGVNTHTLFSGDMGLDVDIKIPLDHTIENTVAGSVIFNNNQLDVIDMPFSFSKLSGTIDFDGNKVLSNNLHADFNGRMAMFNVENKDNGSGIYINLNSWVDAHHLTAYYYKDLSGYLDGSTEFELALNIRKDTDNNQALYLQATSSLIGLKSTLPKPYNKKTGETRPLKLNIEHDFNDFTKYGLTINEPVPGKNKDYSGEFSRIELTKRNHNYDLLINSDQLYGNVSFTNKLDKVTLKLDYLKINDLSFGLDLDDSNRDSHFDIFGLPSISLDIKEVFYKQQPLGNLQLSLTGNTNDKQLFIDSLNLTGDIINYTAQGTYFNDDFLGKSTSLRGDYYIKDLPKLSKLVTNKELTDKIKLKGDYNLNWPGNLIEPKLINISGNIRINSGFGRIKSIEPGLGRIFSLLDLHALNKRLQLDFSDVFEDGYKFDTATGELSITDGIITTNNTSIQAGSADIDLYGKVDLINKTYDLKADVMPHITSGLPIAAAVIGSPVAGAAIFLLDKLLESPVDQLSERAYSISGPWAKPEVQAIQYKRGPLIELSWMNSTRNS